MSGYIPWYECQMFVEIPFPLWWSKAREPKIGAPASYCQTILNDGSCSIKRNRWKFQTFNVEMLLIYSLVLSCFAESWRHPMNQQHATEKSEKETSVLLPYKVTRVYLKSPQMILQSQGHS